MTDEPRQASAPLPAADRPAGARATEGVLLARPAAPVSEGSRSRRPLGLEAPRDGMLYVPRSYRPGNTLPLLVWLHGAGGSAQRGMTLMHLVAKLAGVLILAPSSRGRTWDVIRGAYGPDVEFVDRALAQVFDRYGVDPGRLAIGGFSDGASYALSLGLSNGDLFTHVLAFSPGFIAPARLEGKPPIYIAHGTGDPILPIDRCSRRIVPRLEKAGYEVLYREFKGPHIIPPHLLRPALKWFTGSGTHRRTAG